MPGSSAGRRDGLGSRTLALYTPEYGATISLMINTDGDQVMDDVAFPLLATLLEHLRKSPG